MPGNTRRGFLKGCAAAATAGSVLAGTGGAISTNDAAVERPPHPPESREGWSSPRGGYGNTAAVGSDHGFGEGFDFETLETDWTADAAGLPVVSGGRVYTCVGGAVRAFDAADGSLEWESEDVGADEQPAVGYGTVYVSGEESVAALDAVSGEVRWQTPIDIEAADASVSPATVAFERVYVYGGGTLYAIDCETGSIDWRRDTITITMGDPWETPEDVERSLERGVAATDEQLFTIAESGTIVGLDPQTGEQRLATDTYYYHLYDLVATDERVFVRTESEAVAAYDSTTGDREDVWDGGVRQLAVRGETLVFATRYRLVAIDLESGEQRWAVGTYSHTIGDPVIACNAVLVSFGLQGIEYENSLVAFDIDDGSEQWVFSRAEGASVGGGSVVADRTIYIDDGGLTAIRGTEDESGEGTDDGTDDTDRQDDSEDSEDEGGVEDDEADESDDNSGNDECDRDSDGDGNGEDEEIDSDDGDGAGGETNETEGTADDRGTADDDGGETDDDGEEDPGERGNHALLWGRLLRWMP